MCTDEKLSVIACDPFPIFRIGIETVIRAQPDLRYLGGAGSAKDAVQLLASTSPGVCILEPLFPDATGLEMIQALQRVRENVRILVYSRLAEGISAERCVKLGVRGFLSKEAPPAELIAAIRRIREGNMYLSRDIGLLRLAKMSGRDVEPHELESLSNYEFQVMMLIGEGMTTGQIAQRLNRSIKTVETYRARIKSKLCLSNAVELAQYAARNLRQ